MFGTHLVLLALQKPGQKNLFSLVQRNTGTKLAVRTFYFCWESNSAAWRSLNVYVAGGIL
jgi:hypothetical protein